MPAEETIERAVRVALFEHFAAAGGAPRHDQVVAAAGVTPEQTRAGLLGQLHLGRAREAHWWDDIGFT